MGAKQSVANSDILVESETYFSTTCHVSIETARSPDDDVIRQEIHQLQAEVQPGEASNTTCWEQGDLLSTTSRHRRRSSTL